MEKETMNVAQIIAKANSKREMWRILLLEGDVYLPPLSQANHIYISKILSGEKKVKIFVNNIYFDYLNINMEKWRIWSLFSAGASLLSKAQPRTNCHEDVRDPRRSPTSLWHQKGSTD